MTRLTSKDPFLRARPIVRRATKTHYQIRQLRLPDSSGYGAYLVWPDGPATEETRPIATAYFLSEATERAERPVPLNKTGLDPYLMAMAAWHPTVQALRAAIESAEQAFSQATTLEQRQNWETDIANLRRILLNHADNEGE